MLGVECGIQHLHKALDLIRGAVAVLGERADFLKNVGHLVNGVVTTLGRGTVAGNALHIHTDLHAAAVAAVDAAVGGLGGDNEFHLLLFDAVGGEVLVDDVLPAHTVAVLFLNGTHHHDLIAGGDQAQILHDLGAVSGRGHTALLVGATAAIDDLIILVALVGVMGPVVDVAHAHGVDVGVDGDDLVTVTHPADNVAKAVHLHLVVAQLFHLPPDTGDDRFLLAALTGVGDHLPQEAVHVGAVALRGFPDLLKIHT